MQFMFGVSNLGFRFYDPSNYLSNLITTPLKRLLIFKGNDINKH